MGERRPQRDPRDPHDHELRLREQYIDEIVELETKIRDGCKAELLRLRDEVEVANTLTAEAQADLARLLQAAKQWKQANENAALKDDRNYLFDADKADADLIAVINELSDSSPDTLEEEK